MNPGRPNSQNPPFVTTMPKSLHFLGGHFGYFLFFLCSRWGKEESEAPGGGLIFIENPRRGVSRRERGRGAGRVSAANWGIGGRGAKYSFRGRNVQREMECSKRSLAIERRKT